MYSFSAKVPIPAGTPLGGYGRSGGGSREPGCLEVHGWGFQQAGATVEICSIDALYAGSLALDGQQDQIVRLYAASHTHTGPMLDPTKPALADYSADAVERFRVAIRDAPREVADATRCTVYRGEVTIPVYRRFDHPDSALNRALARRAGLFPNPSHPVDRGVYVVVFESAGRGLFSIVYHACHPVTRSDLGRVSADYVGALRRAVRDRFGTSQCLFFLGCAGDVRPDFSERRVRWLPRSRLNWRFRWPATARDEAATDVAYAEAVAGAGVIRSFDINDHAIAYSRRSMEVAGIGVLATPEVRIGNHLTFRFVPFEVSHRFHLAAQAADPKLFLVSCADHTRGYLPHPTQVRAGGYEVDGSWRAMGLKQRADVRGVFP